MKDLIVFVATDFEDIELISSLDVFTRSSISYDLVSVEDKELVKGKYNAFVKTRKISDIENFDSYRGLLLPGGPGHVHLLESKKLFQIIDVFNKQNKLLAAICAAPEVFKEAKVINGRTFTSFPGFALLDSNSKKEIEIDSNLITARDYKATIGFAEAIVSYLKNK